MAETLSHLGVSKSSSVVFFHWALTPGEAFLVMFRYDHASDDLQFDMQVVPCDIPSGEICDWTERHTRRSGPTEAQERLYMSKDTRAEAKATASVSWMTWSTAFCNTPL